MLIIDGIRFIPWKPKDEEKEFHPIVKEHAREIFGENTRFLDISVRLRSEAGLGSEPDGIVIDPVNGKLYVVEVELSKHDPYKHINDQLTRFINGLDNWETKNKVVEALFNEITSSRDLKDYFDRTVRENLYRWLSQLLSKPPTIVVVIEEKTRDVLEACRILMRSYDTKILEFKTFQREDAPTVHAHLFETLAAPSEPMGEIKQLIEKKSKLPPHYASWDRMLEWVEPATKELANELINAIASLGNVKHKPSGTDYVFYKGKPGSRSVFAALLLRKKSIRVRIRVEPSIFKDPKKWVSEKIYKGWFFKENQERAFDLNERSQIPYAMELIKQSYELAEEQ